MRVLEWMLGLAVLAASGVGTYWLLAPHEAERLRQQRDELQRETAQLRQVIDRLTGEDRVAEVHVIDQIVEGEMVNGRPADETLTTIEFIELDRAGHPLPSKRFVIHDDVVHFDALVIQFEQDLVAAADELRGKSISLFRRIYGDTQEPAEGFPIDPQGDVPNVYRVEPEPTEFEQRLWSQFWDYATDPDLAAQAGIRVAQGQAVYVPMRRGEVWTLSLQSNGGLNLKLHRGVPGSAVPAKENGESREIGEDTSQSGG